MEQPIRENLAQFIVDTRYGELPGGVIHQSKRCILDFLGVAFGGSQLGLAPTMTSLIAAMGGKEEATVLGDGMKIPALQAALVNGVKGHPLDMDDGHRYANGHPGVAVIPAALAIAEREGSTGKELIEAVVAGYDLFIRIAAAINPSHLKRGFHTTGTVGPFGAAAACSKLLCLTRTETANALAIAALEGSGLMEVATSGQIMKPLHPGRAAQAGVLAALLAAGGICGPDLIFEGEKGFCRAYTDLNPEEIKEKLYAGLGRVFEIENVYFKMYPACRHVHSSLDAVREIMKRNAVEIDDIRNIRVRTYSVAYFLTGDKKEVRTGLAAKFSLPVSIGLMLVYGKAGTDEYSEECVNNPLVQKLSEKVEIEVDGEMDAAHPAKRIARVEIATAKETFTFQVDIPHGDPENPWSDDELKEKFFLNAAKLLPRKKMERLQESIFDLENIKIEELMWYVHAR